MIEAYQTLTQLAFEETITATFMPGFFIPTNTPTAAFATSTLAAGAGFDTATPTSGVNTPVVPSGALDGGDADAKGVPNVMRTILFVGLGLGLLVLLVGGGIELYRYLQTRSGGGRDDSYNVENDVFKY